MFTNAPPPLRAPQAAARLNEGARTFIICFYSPVLYAFSPTRLSLFVHLFLSLQVSFYASLYASLSTRLSLRASRATSRATRKPRVVPRVELRAEVRVVEVKRGV